MLSSGARRTCRPHLVLQRDTHTQRVSALISLAGSLGSVYVRPARRAHSYVSSRTRNLIEYSALFQLLPLLLRLRLFSSCALAAIAAAAAASVTRRRRALLFHARAHVGRHHSAASKPEIIRVRARAKQIARLTQRQQTRACDLLLRNSLDFEFLLAFSTPTAAAAEVEATHTCLNNH